MFSKCFLLCWLFTVVSLVVLHNADHPNYYYSHCAGYYCINAYVVLLHLYTNYCSQLNLKWKDLKSDFGPQNEHIRKRMAGQPAGPPARHPTGQAQKNNLFCLVGPARPGPFKTGRAKTGRAGPFWHPYF